MAWSSFSWPEGKRAATIITFDVDAESGVICDYPTAASRLGVMSHQVYGPRTGVPRLLRLLSRQNVAATFFIPGVTAERHPDTVRAIVDEGHEVAHHGYLHERVDRTTEAEEEAVLLRGIDALERIAGIRPVGWRGPMWEVNYRTPALLARHGFKYDSSLMDADCPYRLSVDASSSAPTIVEIPVHWALEDGGHYQWLPEIWEGGRIQNPRTVLDMWTQEFDALTEEGGCFVPTCHPFLSGRPSRAKALELLIEHVRQTPDVWIATAAEVADHVDSLDLPPIRHEPIESTAEVP